MRTRIKPFWNIPGALCGLPLHDMKQSETTAAPLAHELTQPQEGL
jgi:hypothetical protein